MTSMTQTITSLPTSSFMPECEWQHSIDKPCGLLGKFYRCWTAKGPARQLFEEIAGPIKTVLESRSDDLDEGQIIPRTIGFSLYMISLRVFSSASVHPTLLIECENSTVRSRAKCIVRESPTWRNILREHRSLKLAACARGPQACGKETFPNSETPRGSATMVYAHRSFESPCGVPISIYGDDHQIDATLGGIVIVNDIPMGITVAHAFKESSFTPDSCIPEEDDEFAFDSDEDINENVKYNSKSPGKTHQVFETVIAILINVFVVASVASPPKFTSYPQEVVAPLYKLGNMDKISNTFLADLNISSEIPSCTSGTIEAMHDENLSFALGPLYTSSAAFRHNTLDWALFSIDERHHWKPNTLDLPTGATSDSNAVTRITSKYGHLKDDEILAVTSSCGMLKGQLYGTPYYLRMGGSKSFQETWTVNLEAKVG